jgi:hypothetical protein
MLLKPQNCTAAARGRSLSGALSFRPSTEKGKLGLGGQVSVTVVGVGMEPRMRSERAGGFRCPWWVIWIQGWLRSLLITVLRAGSWPMRLVTKSPKLFDDTDFDITILEKDGLWLVGGPTVRHHQIRDLSGSPVAFNCSTTLHDYIKRNQSKRVKHLESNDLELRAAEN